MEKHIVMSFMLIVMALACILLPFFTQLLRIGTLLFVCGATMTFLTTGINTYVMALYGVNSNTALQFIHALDTLGKIITFMSTNGDYHDHPLPSNITITYENREGVFTKLFTSYSILGAFVILLALVWACMYRFAPKEFQHHVPFDDSRQEETTLGFQTLAVVTTLPMFMSTAFLDYVYELLIRTYATHKLERTVAKDENAITFYYISIAVGRLVAIFIAYKLLKPAWMIALDLLLQVFAACLMPLFDKYEDSLLWVVTGLVGFSCASLIPSTLAWLNSQIMVTGRIFGSMSATNYVSLMTVPIWFDDTLQHDPAAALYYMLLVPLFYATIFGLQILLFRREQKSESVIEESSDHEELHRIVDSIRRKMAHTNERVPGEVRRAYTVP